MRELWILANLINLIATGSGAWFASIRWQDAKRRKALMGSERAMVWRRHQVAYLAAEMAINLALFVLGAALILVALLWDRAVPPFVGFGTLGFAAIWIANTGIGIWHWWQLGEIAV